MLAPCLVACWGLACSDGETPAPVELPTGTVELHWTLGAAPDASRCERFGVDAFHATLFDAGYAVERFRAPCEELSATVELFADDYVLSMTLIDEDAFRVTERIVSIRFFLDVGENERIDVDFPVSSFFSDSGDTGGQGGQAQEPAIPGDAAGAGGVGADVGAGGAGGSSAE